jgi:predicted dehydrogenase
MACQEATGCEVVTGGLAGYLATKPTVPTHVIVAVGVEKLHETTLQLLDYGVRSILVEKPAGLDKYQIDAVCLKSKQTNAKVFVAYNRRFYASALKAKEIITEDGGVTSFNFEFTEWAHEIEKLTKAQGVKKHWFLGNSTHVVDLAFYLGGSPKQISSFTAGSVTWHPTASIFSGAGVSKNGALFSYQANWESAGRWSVEILTRVNRLIFRPMEKLQIQKRGSLDISLVPCNYDIDQVFKPGLYSQTKSFIDGSDECLCDIEYQANITNIYNQMASY